MKKLLLATFFVALAACSAHAKSCGIDKAIDTFEASEQEYQDAVPALKIIMLEEDDDSYMHCEVPELNRADDFLDTVVDLIHAANQSMAQQERAIGAIRDSQRKVRAAVEALAK
jgi:hypothetical protein